MITIALDAMGGDHAPRAEVEGAILAAREFGVRILLVGVETTLRHELGRHKLRGLPIEVQNANEVITMTDSPSQVSPKQLRELYIEVKGKKPEGTNVIRNP